MILLSTSWNPENRHIDASESPHWCIIIIIIISSRDPRGESPHQRNKGVDEGKNHSSWKARAANWDFVNFNPQVLEMLEILNINTYEMYECRIWDHGWFLLLMVQKSGENTTWDAQNLVKNGINYQPQLVHLVTTAGAQRIGGKTTITPEMVHHHRCWLQNLDIL